MSLESSSRGPTNMNESAEKEPMRWILDAAIIHAPYEGAPLEIETGKNHSTIRDALRKKYKFRPTDDREQIKHLPSYQEGFVTTTLHNGTKPIDNGEPFLPRFVTRTEAAQIARASGQIIRTSDGPLESWELGLDRM